MHPHERMVPGPTNVQAETEKQKTGQKSLRMTGFNKHGNQIFKRKFEKAKITWCCLSLEVT